MLTIDDVARHFVLKPDTVRRHVRSGAIPAVRINQNYRVDWPAVWACEAGPFPRRGSMDRYKVPLLTKQDLIARLRVSERTVERWLDDGLPTRNVFGRVRLNPYDVEDWLRARFGAEFDIALRDPA